MNSPLRNFAVLVFAGPALVGLLALTACSEQAAETAVIEARPETPSDIVRLNDEALRIAGIVTAPAEDQSLQQEIRVSGRITFNENATARVGSFAEGVVVECCESVGEYVSKGQVLARVHSHEVHDAESEHRRAHEQLEQAKAELQYAQQAQRRASRLYELKAGSLQKLQEADTSLQRAESAVAMAQAELQRTESHLRYLGFDPPDLEHPEKQASPETHESAHDAHLLEIRSPVSGTIIERPVSQGAVVTPSDALYVISDLSRLWIIAQVPEEHLGLIRTGMTADVRVRAYPGRGFSARVTQIGNTLDPETRTAQVRCEIANPDRRLKAEMYVSLVFRAGEGKPAVVVPAAAVQQIDDRHVVFVPTTDGAYRAQSVELGRQADSKVEILSGLSTGEQVVVQGTFALKSELLRSEMIEE